MPLILGLDISSTTIGVSVLNSDIGQPQLIHLTFIKPPKKGNLFERLIKTQNMVQEILDGYKPDIICIEEIAHGFAKFSTPQTLMMLATFNRAVGLTCYNFLHRAPTLVNVMHIRHTLKLTAKPPQKEEMPELVAKHLNIEFPYQYSKKGKLMVENYDMADSIAVGLTVVKDIETLKQDISKLDPANKKHKKKLKLLKQQYKEYTGQEWI